jgi:transcription termination/antitermination protein NusG
MDLHDDVKAVVYSAKKWYVLYVASRMEKSVQKNLMDAIAASVHKDKFGDILVPSEEVLDVKAGKKTLTERRFFPGYILIQMEMNDDTWHLVRSVKKIAGFIGGDKNHPSPVSEKEIALILDQIKMGAEKPKPKIEFQKAEMVRIKDGPFTDFVGVVQDVHNEKSKLHILVSIFGRQTPVELDFSQVEKS